jgi:hypothetical protein
MGADFMYLTIPSAAMTPERKVLLDETIDHLVIEDFEEDWYFDVDDGDKTALDIEKDYLKDVVENYADLGNRRDTGDIMDSDGSWKHITGGMSWGDDPTDAYHIFYRIVNVKKVYDLLHKFAIEDAWTRE